MSRRKKLTTLQRAKLFSEHGGKCHICVTKINGVKEKWEVEHVIPLEAGGDDTIENMAPAHVTCHRAKTNNDLKTIAKIKRISAKHNGAKQPSTMKSRGFRQFEPNVKYIGEF